MYSMYVMYIVLITSSIGFSLLSFYFYGRTHQRHNGPNGMGFGEAQKDNITKKSIPGLKLTINTGTLALVLTLIASCMRLIHFMEPQYKGDYIWIVLGLSIFVLADTIKSLIELGRITKKLK